MESRILGMEKAIKHIVVKYNAKSQKMDEDSEEILKSNVVGQFAEYIWNDKNESYSVGGIINSWDVYQKMKDSQEVQAFVIDSYVIQSETGYSIVVDVELTTGYIMLSTNSSLSDDFRLLQKIENEMILCRGILPEDIESKNMYYFHYIKAQNLFKGDA